MRYIRIVAVHESDSYKDVEQELIGLTGKSSMLTEYTGDLTGWYHGFIQLNLPIMIDGCEKTELYFAGVKVERTEE